MNPLEYLKTELNTELVCNSAPSIEECSKIG